MTVKISDLISGSALDGTEEIPAVQGSETKKITPTQIGDTVTKTQVGLANVTNDAQLAKDGSIAMTGNLDMGSFAVTNVGNVDGRDVSADGTTLDSHTGASSGVHGTTGDVVGTTDTQTLTNKTIDSSNNTIQNLAIGSGVSATLAADLDGGSTQDLNNIVNADIEGYIDLAEIAVPANPAANTLRMFAEDDGGFTTLHVDDASGVDFDLTRDLTLVVRNATGSTITKGTVVYISGSSGQLPQVDLADATSGATMPSLGVVIADIANNSNGQILRTGILDAIDTSAYSDGDPLYVSTTPGAFTGTEPTGTAVDQQIATVVKGGSAGAGIIFVNIGTENDPTLTQTLSNKTVNLSNNTLTGTTAQFNAALSDGSFATLAGTETLTNKTLDLTNNTLTGTRAELNTAISDADFPAATGLSEIEIVRKTANETVNSSTTLQNDDDLTFSIAANERVIIEAHISYVSGTTPDIKFGWSVPSGASGEWGPVNSIYEASGGTISSTNMANLAQTFDYAGSGGQRLASLFCEVSNSTNAGSVTFQWAQNTSDPGDTTVQSDSYLIVHRIA